MNDARFTMNALLIIVIIFLLIGFFFTVKLGDLANHFALNEYYPIQGTDLAVRYSSQEPDGIYRGSRNTGSLLLEGTFGYDWGAAAVGNTLWINEYTNTSLGLMHCRVIRLDLSTLQREVLSEDTVLRGTCASGELVCLRGSLLPSNNPDSNPLCELYRATARSLLPKGAGAEVIFLDPETGELLWSVREEAAPEEEFEERYLGKTLEEVRG